MIKVKSLQQRLMLFLLLPVAALLLGMGIVGFIYARNSLLKEWREASILRLQRAAHDVDMRLSRPKEWLEMYHKTGGEHFDEHTQEWILDQLRHQEGVEEVNLTRVDEQTGGHDMGQMSKAAGMDEMQGMMREMHRKEGMKGLHKSMMRFHMGRIAEITPPRYDSVVEHETLSIISELNDVNGKTIGQLEVVISFEYLVKDINAAGWWQSNKAFLVDNTGKVLICTEQGRRYLGDNNDPLELATLKAIKDGASGTILGQGDPSDEVSGFYRLKEAPWTLIMVAPGRTILEPIVRFRKYYMVTGALFILFVLFLIHWVTGRTVSSIKRVSSAADRVARGDYSVSLPVKSQDEVGQLIQDFNLMVDQLQERMKLKEELNLAKEVQQSLLPMKPPEIEGFDIAGKSIYCDETGGDYYDFIEFSESSSGRIGIAVGDVAGHGIAPALLMTTFRAILRSRTKQPGSLSQIVTDVNRLLCIDTAETGNFMTLFLMLLDPENREVRWVRAGHEPAIVYDLATDSFAELHGDGIALGVDDTWSFEEQQQEAWTNGQVILIGTDGIWETENPQGEMFGKKRLRGIIRQHRNQSSQEIVEAITGALTNHRQTAPQQDDITMVVIKKF